MTPNSIPNEIRKAVYARDGYRCALCDSTRYIQIHHYIKRSLGGSNSMHNLITLCQDCHCLVHGIPLEGSLFGVDEMDQFIVEYLEDTYTSTWNPWRKE